MTHIYIPKSSDMWCIHHYGSTEVNMHLDFQGPLKHRDSFGKEKCKKNYDLIIITPSKVQLITCIDFFGGHPNNSKNNSKNKRDSEQTITAR